MSLVPCPSCSRHVRSSESACPFCSSALPTNLGARAIPSAPRRLDRLAAFTFDATLVVTGCAVAGDESDEQESEIGSVMPMYGLPPPPLDAGVSDSSTSTDGGPSPDAGPCDTGGFHAMYGLPPLPPCPVTDAGTPVQDGGSATDAGPRDAGGFHAMYGLPPD